MNTSAPLCAALLFASAFGQESDVTEMDDIVITGTRTEKSLSEVPVRTQVVDRKQITSIAANTLADAVEYTPGVRVENNCQNCGFTQLRLLGLEGKYTQILENGLPRMSSVAAVYGLEQIPARLIDQIEIVKGGGSALYGPGAVAGVVNVITRDPSESGVSLNAMAEDVDGSAASTFSAASDYVSENGRTLVTVMGQVINREAYDRNEDGFSDLGELELESLGARMRHFVGDHADLTLEYHRIREYRRGGNRLDLPQFQADVAESTDAVSDNGSIVWSHAPSNTFDYTLALGIVDFSRDSYYGAGQDPNAYGFTDSPLYTADSQFNHYLDGHVVSWGVQATREELNDVFPGYGREVDESYTNVGIFLQDDWALTEDISLVLGARLDDNSEISDPIVSPRVALKWSASPAFTVRASYAEGFRAPQIFDEDLHITIAGGEPQLVVNADDLNEERSRSYMLGGEWTPVIGDGFGLIEVTGFYTDLRDTYDTVSLGNDGTGDIFERINAGGSEVYGTEFNLGYQVADRLEIRLGWVLQQAQFDKPAGDFGSREYERTPESYGVFQTTYSLETWEFFLGAKYTGSMKVPHYAGFIPEDRLETSDTFLIWDLIATKSLPFNGGELEASIGVKNLTDDYQDDLDEGPDRDAGYMVGPRFPRSIFASLGLTF